MFLIRNQCCGSGSGSVLDPYSGASWIRICIRNTDLDPHMQIKVKTAAEDVKFNPLVTIATFVDRFSSNLQSRLKRVKIEFHFFKFF